MISQVWKAFESSLTKRQTHNFQIFYVSFMILIGFENVNKLDRFLNFPLLYHNKAE